MIRRRQSHESACECARALASAQLDGVLCEFDRHQLDRHLAGCEDCAGVIAEMALVTARVRSAPPQPVPVASVVAAASRPRRRRTRIAPLRAAAVVSAMAAAGALGFAVASPHHHQAPASPQPPKVAQRFPIGMFQARNWPQPDAGHPVHLGRHGFDV
jgi:anti-sigma factor RsiW